MKITLIVNPTAGGGRAQRVLSPVAARLRERGADVSVVAGTYTDTREALDNIQQTPPDIVAVIGGDGTARLAIEALTGTDIPLALIRVGTGNDLAGHFGIPRDPLAAADLIFDGEDRRIDVVRATQDDATTHLFASIFASGFDSKVNDRANRMRWPQGRAKYNIAIAIEFALLKSIPYRLNWVDENGEAFGYTGPLLLTAVGNTATYGGGVPICPAADPQDGLLDLTFVRPASRIRLIRVLAAAFRGEHVRAPEVETHRVRSIRLDADNLTGYADGDGIGRLPMTLDVIPAALVLRAPRP